ncbi:MAG: hypothetical protein ACLTYW_03970 [Collinsella sp.]
MLEGLFDADRWSTTFQNMGPFWEGFGVTLQVVVAGLLCRWCWARCWACSLPLARACCAP